MAEDENVMIEADSISLEDVDGVLLIDQKVLELQVKMKYIDVCK